MERSISCSLYFRLRATLLELVKTLLTKIGDDVERLGSQRADLADGIRQVKRALSAEINDCRLIPPLIQITSKVLCTRESTSCYFATYVVVRVPRNLKAIPGLMPSYIIDQPRQRPHPHKPHI